MLVRFRFFEALQEWRTSSRIKRIYSTPQVRSKSVSRMNNSSEWGQVSKHNSKHTAKHETLTWWHYTNSWRHKYASLPNFAAAPVVSIISCVLLCERYLRYITFKKPGFQKSNKNFLKRFKIPVKLFNLFRENGLSGSSKFAEAESSKSLWSVSLKLN